MAKFTISKLSFFIFIFNSVIIHIFPYNIPTIEAFEKDKILTCMQIVSKRSQLEFVKFYNYIKYVFLEIN